MKTYSYKMSDKSGRPIAFDLTAETAQYLYEELQQDLGYDKPTAKPVEQKINFVPPPSLQKVTSPNESWIYISRKTGRLFRRTSHEYDAGRTWVFNAMNMTWDIDENHLWDSEVLHGSIVSLDSIGRNDGSI
jgi:hypothetical protein